MSDETLSETNILLKIKKNKAHINLYCLTCIKSPLYRARNRTTNFIIVLNFKIQSLFWFLSIFISSVIWSVVLGFHCYVCSIHFFVFCFKQAKKIYRYLCLNYTYCLCFPHIWSCWFTSYLVKWRTWMWGDSIQFQGKLMRDLSADIILNGKMILFTFLF